jgi:hypothetical protein
MQILRVKSILLRFRTFVMVKYAIISMLSRNKNLNGKHHFFPFRTTNAIVQSMNNKQNQLQTKLSANKRKHIK